MRTFIAINLPENVKLHLSEIQGDLFKEVKGISLTRDYHLTLKFLGEVDDGQIANIKKSLSNIKFKKFAFHLANLGFFPNQRLARVIWVGINPESDVLELQSLIEESLKQYFPKDEKFKPHITLARAKYIKNREESLQGISNTQIKALQVNVDDFRLIRSTLTRTGAIYTDLEIYQL